MRVLCGVLWGLVLGAGALGLGACTSSPPPEQPRGCGEETDTCRSDSECCSGRCRDSGFAVFGNLCTCTASGEICSSSSQCCAGLTCFGNLCQCIGRDLPCTRATPCCAGLTCLAGTCR